MKRSRVVSSQSKINFMFQRYLDENVQHTLGKCYHYLLSLFNLPLSKECRLEGLDRWTHIECKSLSLSIYIYFKVLSINTNQIVVQPFSNSKILRKFWVLIGYWKSKKAIWISQWKPHKMRYFTDNRLQPIVSRFGWIAIQSTTWITI